MHNNAPCVWKKRSELRSQEVCISWHAIADVGSFARVFGWPGGGWWWWLSAAQLTRSSGKKMRRAELPIIEESVKEHWNYYATQVAIACACVCEYDGSESGRVTRCSQEALAFVDC